MGEDLPPPDASLVICRVAIESLIEVIGPRKGERLLKCMADRLTTEERLSEIMPIRPSKDHAAVTKARREAMVWFRQVLPTFMARL